MSEVLVIGAHPDDEAVGCGGTLRRHVLDGDTVRALFLTSGEAGGHGIEDAGAVREREALAAAEILGTAQPEFWREPDGRLRARASVVERLAEAIARYRPALVYAPHPGDDHPDHRAAARIVRLALRAAGSGVPLRQFEIWTPLAQIDHVIDVSAQIEVKRAAIRAYRSQCDVMSFDEAFAGLARYRGEMHSWPGGAYAEVFSERRR
jgi:LmbE family N-acetylglucosaminyl deacetylase